VAGAHARHVVPLQQREQVSGRAGQQVFGRQRLKMGVGLLPATTCGGDCRPVSARHLNHWIKQSSKVNLTPKTRRDFVRVAGPGVYVGCAYRRSAAGQYSKDDCTFFMLVRAREKRKDCASSAATVSDSIVSFN